MTKEKEPWIRCETPLVEVEGGYYEGGEDIPDALPRKYEQVWAWDADRGPIVATYKGWWEETTGNDDISVSHWMPLEECWPDGPEDSDA